VGCPRRGQEWRLGNWGQLSHHERCQGISRWQVERLTLPNRDPGYREGQSFTLASRVAPARTDQTDRSRVRLGVAYSLSAAPTAKISIHPQNALRTRIGTGPNPRLRKVRPRMNTNKHEDWAEVGCTGGSLQPVSFGFSF